MSGPSEIFVRRLVTTDSAPGRASIDHPLRPALADVCLRALALPDTDALTALLSRAADAAATPGLPADVGRLLAALPSLFAEVGSRLDDMTDQRDRGLAELAAVNERLYQQLLEGRRAVGLLSATAARLVAESGEAVPAEGGLDLDRASRLLDRLVGEREASRLALEQARAELAQQKLALDRHAIVSMTDLNGRITYVNTKFEQISGYQLSELLGRPHSFMQSGVHGTAFYQGIWSSLTRGESWEGEICNRRKDGSLYWVSATILPLQDETGRPSRYIAIRTDISARKAAERELDRQLHFSRELIEAIPMPIYFKDLEGRYQGFNKAFERLFGIDRAHWIGRTIHDLFPADFANQHAERDEVLLREGGTQVYEASVLSAAGERLDMLYQKAVLTRPDGSISGLVGSLTDISARKRVEADLLAARHAAEAASHAKSEFLANMSHEIRTPMNGILGMAELALDTPPGAEQRGYIEAVKQSAEALLDIIGDILDFSKIEAGKLVLESIPFSPRRLLDELAGLFVHAARAKALTLEVKADGALPEALLGDPGRLRQVLVNLVGNAIKFTSEGGVRVHARAEPVEGACRLWLAVEDTGIGIPSDKIDLIFEAFAQEDASTTRRFGGTGLGLAITSHLARLMDGELRVQSEPGRGSRFELVLTLPLAPAAVAAPATDGPTERWPAERPALRILLVEDHPVNQALMLKLLTRWGHRVQCARNGAEAVDACQGGTYDLVLMDMQMPGMGGLEATRLIRHAEATRGASPVPILALTAAAMEEDRRAALAAGVDGYLTKPIRQHALLAALLAHAPAGAAAETQADPEPPVAVEFDYRLALARVDPLVLDIVADTFISQSEVDLARMRRAAQAGDTAALANAALAFKGACAEFIGVPPLALAGRIADAARAGRVDEAALNALAPQLTALNTALQQALALPAHSRKAVPPIPRRP